MAQPHQRTAFLLYLLVCVCLGTTLKGNPQICPGYNELMPSDAVLATCMDGLPDTRKECEELLRHLQETTSRTVQNRIDLAEGQYYLWKYFIEEPQMAERYEIAATEFRSLSNEFPSDPRLMFRMSMFVEYDKALDLRRKIIEVAPGCSRISKYLVEVVGIESDEGSQYAWDGYSNAESKPWKISFASMLFKSMLRNAKKHAAIKLRDDVFRELKIDRLVYSDSDRQENLLAICSHESFDLRFAKYCMNGIESAIDHDVVLGVTPGNDVITAIHHLSSSLDDDSLLGVVGKRERHPAELDQFKWIEVPHFPHETLEYTLRLQAMLADVPVELLSYDLVFALSAVLTRSTKVQLMKQLVSNDQNDERARRKLEFLLRGE